MPDSKKRKDRLGGNVQDSRGMKRSKVRPSHSNFPRKFHLFLIEDGEADGFVEKLCLPCHNQRWFSSMNFDLVSSSCFHSSHFIAYFSIISFFPTSYSAKFISGVRHSREFSIKTRPTTQHARDGDRLWLPSREDQEANGRHHIRKRRWLLKEVERLSLVMLVSGRPAQEVKNAGRPKSSNLCWKK